MPLANDNTGGATGWCLEVHDLAVSKLVAGRDKDLNFVRVLERPLAAYLLHRDFTANAPNQRWAGDTSESLVGESRSELLLATIPDLFPRFVVAWAVSAVNDRHPTLKALGMAIKRRCPEVFYNHQRRHSTLGLMSLAAFDRRAAA